MCLCCCKCIRGNPCAFACGHACLSWVPSCAAFALCCTPIQGRQGSFVIQFVVLSSRHALLLCGFHCRRLVSYGRAFTVLVCMRLSPAVVCVRWTGHSARVRMSSFDLSAHFCNYICFGAFIPALPYLDKQSRRATCRKRMLDAAVIHHTAWCHITFSECQHSLSVMCGSWIVEHSHAHLHRCTHCNGLRV